MNAADRQAQEFRNHALAVYTAEHTRNCEACLRAVAAYLRGLPDNSPSEVVLLSRIERLIGGDVPSASHGSR